MEEWGYSLGEDAFLKEERSDAYSIPKDDVSEKFVKHGLEEV